jgi:hypothetical protein
VKIKKRKLDYMERSHRAQAEAHQKAEWFDQGPSVDADRDAYPMAFRIEI